MNFLMRSFLVLAYVLTPVLWGEEPVVQHISLRLMPTLRYMRNPIHIHLFWHSEDRKPEYREKSVLLGTQCLQYWGGELFGAHCPRHSVQARYEVEIDAPSADYHLIGISAHIVDTYWQSTAQHAHDLEYSGDSYMEIPAQFIHESTIAVQIVPLLDRDQLSLALEA